MQRLGIYSGLFDPIHTGHISFALKATQAAKLDKIYFLVEPKARRKTGVTHLAHRIAMVKLATKLHNKLEVLELPDKQFSVAKTLPRLQQRFKNDQLVFLAGSDMLEHMPDWPLINRLLEEMELVIGIRGNYDKNQTRLLKNKLPASPRKLFVLNSPSPQTSSGGIRKALMLGGQAEDITPDVRDYIKRRWLYVSPAPPRKTS